MLKEANNNETNQKIISCLLILSAFMSTGAVNTFAADYKDCSLKSRHGKYWEEDCAHHAGVKKIQNGESYVKISNIGYKGQYSLYFFDFNSLEKIIPEMTSVKNDPILYNKKWLPDKFIENLGTVAGGAIGAGIAAFGVHKFLQKNKLEGSRREVLAVKAMIGTAVTMLAGASAVLGNSIAVGHCVSKNIKSRKLISTSKENVKSAMDQLETYLRNKNWKGNDFICISLNSRPGHHRATVEFRHNDISKYTAAERASLEKKFKALEADVNKFLAENK